MTKAITFRHPFKGWWHAFVGCLIAIPSLGHGSLPEDTPVDRLVTNLGKYVKEHPQDPGGYYRLGRVHTLALATKTETIYAWPDRDEPAEGSFAKIDPDWQQRNPASTEAQRLLHSRQALANLSKAIELRPAQPRYRLTLACALEASLPLFDKMDVWAPATPPPDAGRDRPDASDWVEEDDFLATLREAPTRLEQLLQRVANGEWSSTARNLLIAASQANSEPGLASALAKLRRADWDSQIEQQYFTAMSLALPREGPTERRPIWGDLDDLVIYEAAHNFLRIVRARPPQARDFIRVRVAEAVAKAVESLPPPRMITPVVLDLRHLGLDQLRAAHTVGFDVDGSRRAQRWSWVTANAGILAWDPKGTGRITSGRQLFGSASWWLLFDDGYQALDALDDDRDGALAGNELAGIAVWFDIDGDGVSDRGEVTPIEQLGIDSLACRATATISGCLANLTGARRSDGRTAPTYDWVSTRTSANAVSRTPRGLATAHAASR